MMGDMTNALPAPLPEIQLSSLAFTVSYWLIHEGHEDHVDLDAPYQRPSVWTLDQRRALMKSLFMGLPVGAVVGAKLPYDNSYSSQPGKFLRVVDGQQRVRCVRAFADNEFSIPGHWLTEQMLEDPAKRSDEVTFSDLSRFGRITFDMRQLPLLEFESTSECRHDADGQLIRSMVKDSRTGQMRDGGAKRFPRTFNGALAAEAELFGLLNGGGTAQTDEHMTNVAKMAAEWSKS